MVCRSTRRARACKKAKGEPEKEENESCVCLRVYVCVNVLSCKRERQPARKGGWGEGY
jgi:hypothetical protein